MQHNQKYPITAVFYIDRGEPELHTPSIHNAEYTPIKDFGIYPLLYIHDTTSRDNLPIEHIVRNYLNKKYRTTQNLKSLIIRGTQMDLFEQYGKPWLLCADKICEYKTNIKNFDNTLRDMNVDYNKVVFTSSYECTKRMHDELFKREEPALDMLRYLLGKIKDKLNKDIISELGWLRKFIRDSYEMYIWHGNQIGVILYRTTIIKIYHEYIESNLNDLLGLYWYKNNDNLYQYIKSMYKNDNKK